MNKFTRLTAFGSTILISIAVLAISIIYFGIKEAVDSKPLLKKDQPTDVIDTVRIERIIEKPVHDTIWIEVPCSRRHWDNTQIINKRQSLNRLDSIQKDTQINNGY